MSLLASQNPTYLTNIPCGDGNNSGWGGNFGEWILVFLLASMFGWGGFGGGFGGMGGMGMMWPWMMMNGFGGWGGRDGGCGCGCGCATPADVRAAVDQQTLISKIDQQTYGMADVYNGLSRDINNNFRNVDNAICTLGYQAQQGFSGLGAQLAQCCCDIERSIDGNTNAGLMNTMNIQRQISDCCCDLEKANMQNRFDAQSNHCGTLQAIDKLGDRIIGWLSDDRLQSLRDENQTLRSRVIQADERAFFAANQEAQTATLLRRLGAECPQPAYLVNAPTPVSFPTDGCGNVRLGGWNNGGNGCGCRSCA